ncbi:hypothetical protein EDB83DRAFT_2373083, partial [Lactarius deliciosus]
MLASLRLLLFLRGFGSRTGGKTGGCTWGGSSSGRGGRGLRDGHNAGFVALQECTVERLASYREHCRRAPALVKDLCIR